MHPFMLRSDVLPNSRDSRRRELDRSYEIPEIGKKTFLNLALLCVIDSVDLYFGRNFFNQVFLHILGQTKRKIFKRKYFAYYIYFFNKFQTFSSLLGLHSPVCVVPGRKPRLFWRLLSTSFLMSVREFASNQKF